LKFTTSYLNKVNRFLNETKIWIYGYIELVYFQNKILYDKSYYSNLKKPFLSLPDNLKKSLGPLITLSTLVIQKILGIAGITLATSLHHTAYQKAPQPFPMTSFHKTFFWPWRKMNIDKKVNKFPFWCVLKRIVRASLYPGNLHSKCCRVTTMQFE
jgi:hypothetical protein